jgi:hypothetical protein
MVNILRFAQLYIVGRYNLSGQRALHVRKLFLKRAGFAIGGCEGVGFGACDVGFELFAEQGAVDYQIARHHLQALLYALVGQIAFLIEIGATVY